MDPRYLGGSLIARNAGEAARHRPSTPSEEDAYCMRHSPADTGLLKVTSAIAAVWMGLLLTVDFLLR